MTDVKRRIRVLGFDSWTMGGHHYSRLLPAFAESNIEFLLVHLGSWGEDIRRQKEEVIDGMLVRDITYYGQCSIEHVLEVERPDLVLFLSTEAFLHQAFQRYCFARGIPTLHLFHGLMGVVPMEAGIKAYRVNLLRQIMYLLERAGKFLRRTIFVYGRALIATGGTFADWRKFGEDVFIRMKGEFVVIPARDSKATRCCVYTQADYATAKVKWDYDDEEVIAVGNPDLGRFGLDERLLGAGLRPSLTPVQQIVYIDSGISSHGLNFSSDRDYSNYLRDCANSLKCQGYHLSVKLKPHPPSRFECIREKLLYEDVTVLDNDEFVPALTSCAACIVEPSTASLIPCLLGIPVLLVRVAQLNTLLYGEVFVKYPRAIYLEHWEDIPEKIADICDADTVQATNRWIKNNAGPMPASDMPKRVAGIVLDLVNSQQSLVLQNIIRSPCAE